jgi:hypothetical protein
MAHKGERGPYKKGEIPPGFKRYQEERRRQKEEATTLKEQAQQPEVAEALASTLPADIGAVFLEIQRAVSTKDAQEAANTLAKAMARLPASAVADLMATPSYQAIIDKASLARVGTRPGDPILDERGRVIGTVPWRHEDFFEEGEEWKEFMGEENLVFYINNVEWSVAANKMCKLPPSVYHYYVENRMERKRAETGDDVFEWLNRITGGHARRT